MEKSNICLKFVPVTFLCGYAGALTLRWLQLGLLYRTLDQYFVGIASTLLIVSLLAGIMAIFMVKALLPMNDLVRKIQNGKVPDEKDRLMAGKVYGKIRVIVFIENAIGFILGQTSVAVIDFMNGVYPFTPSRFAIIVVQAVCIGLIISLYEIYYFDLIFLPFREMLNIHSMKVYGKKGSPVSSKILLVSAVTLLFMGTNAMSTAYGILNGDNVSSSTDLMGEYLHYGIGCVALNFVECLGLMLIVCLEMKNRLRGITKIVGELEQSGDLSKRINISMNDDIGELTGNQNALMDKLSSTIVSLKDETNAVTTSAQILNESSSKSLDALRQMEISVQRIDAEDKKTSEVINMTYTDIDSLRNSAQQVEQQILNQSNAMDRASSSIKDMANNIADISRTAKKADEISENLRTTTDKGLSSINSAEDAMNLIAQSSGAVENAVATIKKISNQINLLAMNASIEAAHAGQFGKGFAVVADEVRSLANTTAKNVKTISENIQEMDDKIKNGVVAVQEAKNSFAIIGEGVTQTADVVRQIAESVEDQRVGANETLSATQEVVKSIESIKNLAISQRQHTDNVLENTKSIVESSDIITSSLLKTSEANENLSSILNDVNNCVAENNSSIQKMKQYIDAFKIGGE